MKSWVCELCSRPISELGSFVKMTSSRYRHLTCHDTRMLDTGYQNGRRVLLEEQADEARHARELQAAREQTAQEQARAKALAAENERLEKARIANLTAAAREALRREQQGEATERFSLVEVATPEEVAALETGAKQEQERVKTRQQADAEKMLRDAGAQILEKKDIEVSDVEEALKRGVRPLELE